MLDQLAHTPLAIGKDRFDQARKPMHGVEQTQDPVPDGVVVLHTSSLHLSACCDEEMLAALGALPTLPDRGFTAGHGIGADARASWAFR